MMQTFLRSLAGCSLLVLVGCGSGGTLPNTTAPAVMLSTTSVTFSQVALQTTSAAQHVTVTNTGTATLTISGITLGGTNASLFAETDTCGASLPAGSSCMIALTYTPASPVVATASLTLTDNAATSPQTITLTGSTNILSQCKTAPPSTVVHPQPTSNYAGTTFAGTVSAGSVPVTGAIVQLYAAGTAGNGSAPTPLGTAVVTDIHGAFALTAAYTCPFNTSMLYLVARGGQADTLGAPNAGIVFATVIGACDSFVLGQSYKLNEATTVATAYALAQFFSAGGKIGATATNFQGLILAAATAANLVDVTKGTAPGSSFPPNGTAPTARLNTVANALNACAVSSSAASSACSGLYSSVAANGSAAPSNTLDAAMLLAQNPTRGTTLYGLSTASAAYAPVLASAPSDWTMFITYKGSGMDNPLNLSFDSNGNIWVANYGSVASYFTNGGTPVFANGITGNNLYESFGVAVDENDVSWITNEQTPFAINNGYGTMTLFNSAGSPVAGSAGYSAGGIHFPADVAIDRGAVSWIVDYGDSSLTLLNNDGVSLAGPTGYTSALFNFPVAVAVDSNCYGFLVNQSGNTVTKVALDGSSFTNYPVGQTPSGVAIDAADNVWVTDYGDSSVSLISNAGTVLSGTGFTGAGLSYPQGIAIDGGGTVWAANYHAPGISKLAGSAAAVPGAAISPATGLGPDAPLVEAFGIAIDASGNVWVTSYGSSTLTEFVGLAVPVKMPLLGPVSLP